MPAWSADESTCHLHLPFHRTQSIRGLTAGGSATTTASPSPAAVSASRRTGSSSNATNADDASSSAAKRKRPVVAYIELSDDDDDEKHEDEQDEDEDDDVVAPGKAKGRLSAGQPAPPIKQAPRFSGKSSINMEAERSLADMYCDNTDEEMEAIAQLESAGRVANSSNSRPVAGSSRLPALSDYDSDAPLAGRASTSMGGFFPEDEPDTSARRPLAKKARRARIQIDSDSSDYEEEAHTPEASDSESDHDYAPDAPAAHQPGLAIRSAQAQASAHRAATAASAAAAARSAVPGSSSAAAGPSSAASGAYDNQQQFETAIQRRRRLKSEGRTSRLKKKPRMSQVSSMYALLLRARSG